MPTTFFEAKKTTFSLLSPFKNYLALSLKNYFSTGSNCFFWSMHLRRLSGSMTLTASKNMPTISILMCSSRTQKFQSKKSSTCRSIYFTVLTTQRNH